MSQMVSRAVTDATTTWDTLVHYTRRPRGQKYAIIHRRGTDDWAEEVNEGADVVSTKTMTKVF